MVRWGVRVWVNRQNKFWIFENSNGWVVCSAYLQLNFVGDNCSRARENQCMIWKKHSMWSPIWVHFIRRIHDEIHQLAWVCSGRGNAFGCMLFSHLTDCFVFVSTRKLSLSFKPVFNFATGYSPNPKHPSDGLSFVMRGGGRACLLMVTGVFIHKSDWKYGASRTA